MKTILSLVLITLFVLGMYSFRSVNNAQDLDEVRIENVSDVGISLGDTTKVEKAEKKCEKKKEVKKEKKCDKSKKEEKAEEAEEEKEEKEE